MNSPLYDLFLAMEIMIQIQSESKLELKNKLGLSFVNYDGFIERLK